MREKNLRVFRLSLRRAAEGLFICGEEGSEQRITQ